MYVVDFDAPAQASDFRIKMGQVVFLWWLQDSNLKVSKHPFASRLNAHSQTDWAIEDKAKTWTQQLVTMMSEHSAHLTSLPFGFRTWPWRYTLLFLISMLWHRQAIFEYKGDKLSSSAECRTRTWKSQDTYSPADWMPTHGYIHACIHPSIHPPIHPCIHTYIQWGAEYHLPSAAVKHNGRCGY